MGNCQAAEAETVLIQHPGGRMERIYWPMNASQVMTSNPGHYVAIIITSHPGPPGGTAPVKHLKLLRPDDTLQIGHVYRLVSFEEVLREFSSKKRVKLSRFLNAEKKNGTNQSIFGADESSPSVTEVEGGGKRSEEATPVAPRRGQWRPTLQSIAEDVGS
ncbi:hypothetical protein HPP92_024614 [Vanilla planifolia]|uniref:Uncharacterized protein n=1 Tax=Vanilla planifolia TaxID=51239 RepID=A0A835PKI7_VANPL|nr:hypothetical protein HPP92_024908 [Vanilla planifolia]KAG0456826.1 hypothetical protein HPP92_024614 [Vanilla planifolia]